MSYMIPRNLIDTFRDFVDLSLEIFGIDCTLYIPTTSSSNTAERLDVFASNEDYTFEAYTTTVFIEWNPSTYRLKKYGIFTEDTLPILAWLPNKATPVSGSSAGTEVEIDVIEHSYFQISPEFIPDDYSDTEEFELVNTIVKHMHDAVLVKGFAAAPRRIQQS